MTIIELFRRLLATLAQARQRQITRRQLRHLDRRLLRDIGLSHEAAMREADKPFWRA